MANADKIKVILSDKREFDAEITGRDPETDIAVIKINVKVSINDFDDSYYIM